MHQQLGSMDASGPAIHAIGLAKHYRAKVAVDSIDFDVPTGSVCGFLGPNGAGKTSTIRMLMGLLPPTQGRLRVLGLDPARQPMELRQQVGYVPEQHFIYKWMTVAQVLRFAAVVYQRWDTHECNRAIDLLALPITR